MVNMIAGAIDSKACGAPYTILLKRLITGPCETFEKPGDFHYHQKDDGLF
jgi:hypothetical protein